MAKRSGEGLSSSKIPQACSAVIGGCEQPVASQIKSGRAQPILMFGRIAEQLARECIPNMCCVIKGLCCSQLEPIRAELSGINEPVGIFGKSGNLLARACIPNAYDSIPGSCDKSLAVRTEVTEIE